MTAKEADELKPGDTIYCMVGGHPQTGTVYHVRKERNCRRITFDFTTKAGKTFRHAIRHGSAWK